MNRYCNCQHDEEQSEQPMFSHKDRTEKKCDPDHAYGYDLYLKRYGLMEHEVLNIWTEPPMVKKPFV